LVSIGIVEKNSVAYVNAAFDSLEKGHVVVPFRSLEDPQRLAATKVSEVVDPEVGGGWIKRKLSIPDNSGVAHIAFTSGTEGEPKGVLISQTALNDVVSRVQSLMQMDHNVKEYIGVPVYHSFGYGRCRHVASVGGSFYIPNNGFDPREITALLAAAEINALSLVPSLLRVFLSSPELLSNEGHKLKWLEIGSQVLTRDEKLAVRALFPNARIVQHYGLTEASRTTLLQIDGVDENILDSVGLAIGDVQLKISAKGLICIKGSHVAKELLVDGRLTPVTDKDGWLETSDLGRLDDGYLYFEGRADNVVNCGGQKLSTEKLEAAIIGAKPELLSKFTVSRVYNNVYGEGFLVSFIELSGQQKSILKSVAMESLDKLGIYAKNVIVFNCIEEIPKTHTGKVQHKKLVGAYEAGQSKPSGSEFDIEKTFAQFLGIDELDPSLSVSDIGIDSIQSIQLSIKLESMLGYLPIDWRERSISSLLELPHKKPKRTQLKSPVISKESNKAEPIWDGSSNMNPGEITFWQLVKEDFVAHERDFLSQGFFALFVHRFGNWRMGIKTKLFRFPMTILYRILRKITQIFCGIKLDYTVHVGRRVKLEHFGGMILGARSIGDDVIIRQNTTFGIRDLSDLSAKPAIEEGVNIGAGVVIVGDITIGRHSIIGPNSVITEDIPPFSVVSVGAAIITNCTD